mgnify:CR=1 FL=1
MSIDAAETAELRHLFPSSGGLQNTILKILTEGHGREGTSLTLSSELYGAPVPTATECTVPSQPNVQYPPPPTECTVPTSPPPRALRWMIE